MSFRKRNVALPSGAPRGQGGTSAPASVIVGPSLPGLRPSPLDGRATTSTGTPTLDGLLAGHAGLPTGTSILIEENGTTDYAGALLRYYAAEGLVQGHHVHVMGVPEQWGRELPGLVGGKEKDKHVSISTERMKIAWRYERLGQPGSGTISRGGPLILCNSIVLDQYTIPALSTSSPSNTNR
jgi:elongator complex protein 4